MREKIGRIESRDWVFSRNKIWCFGTGGDNAEPYLSKFKKERSQALPRQVSLKPKLVKLCQAFGQSKEKQLTVSPKLSLSKVVIEEAESHHRLAHVWTVCWDVRLKGWGCMVSSDVSLVGDHQDEEWNL